MIVCYLSVVDFPQAVKVMVMETPSPQCVGREFVRQYYTLLHEAPMHLHRFVLYIKVTYIDIQSSLCTGKIKVIVEWMNKYLM